MKRIILLIVFGQTVLLSSLNAQLVEANESAIVEHLDYLRRERLMPDSSPKAYENINGTPYLKNDFQEGKVYLKSGEIYTGKYRFDLYANQIQFINNDNMYVIAFPEKIFKVELNGYTWKYIDYKIDMGLDKGYFISMVEGYVSLFLNKSKTLKDPESPKPYQQPRPAKFLDHRDLYYIKIGEKPAVRVTNKRNLIKAFDDLGPQIKRYMKKERIKTRKTEDLIELVNYANEELLNNQ